MPDGESEDRGGRRLLEMAGLYEVYEEAGQHLWVLRDYDARILARSDGYPTRAGALRGIELLRLAALTANVVEVGCRDASLEPDDRIV